MPVARRVQRRTRMAPPANQAQYDAMLAQLTAIREAIASGVTRVAYDGKSSEFRTLDELLRIEEILQDALGMTQPGQTTTTVLAAHDRGFPQSWGAYWGSEY